MQNNDMLRGTGRTSRMMENIVQYMVENGSSHSVLVVSNSNTIPYTKSLMSQMFNHLVIEHDLLHSDRHEKETNYIRLKNGAIIEFIGFSVYNEHIQKNPTEYKYFIDHGVWEKFYQLVDLCIDRPHEIIYGMD